MLYIPNRLYVKLYNVIGHMYFFDIKPAPYVLHILHILPVCPAIFGFPPNFY